MKQLNIQIDDMDYLTVGEVLDMCTEQANDMEKYTPKATQADIDSYARL